MLEGATPFKAESPLETYCKVLSGKFEFRKIEDPLCSDLIRRLLEIDESKRLGGAKGNKGGDDVKRHAFFENIDFEKVEMKEYSPYWVPDLKDDADV